MNKLTIFLAVFLALAVLTIGLQAMFNRNLLRSHDETARDFRRANARIQLQRDSIAFLELKVDGLQRSMVLKVSDLRDSLKWQQSQTSQWKSNYVKAKNTRLPADIPDAELDSIISGLVGSDR